MVHTLIFPLYLTSSLMHPLYFLVYHCIFKVYLDDAVSVLYILVCMRVHAISQVTVRFSIDNDDVILMHRIEIEICDYIHPTVIINIGCMQLQSS